tara:strand:+ start:3105 stop:4856 length:1752 start_codon:yes stop_codon:yes gene_type:complete
MKKLSRKEFIKLSSMVASGFVLIPQWLYPLIKMSNKSNFLRNSFNDKILVVVNLNGGNDGLNTVIPYQDQNYYNLRPDIAIDNDTVLPITNELGLHPALTHLANFWNQRKLCVIENVGYNNQNLSHFRSTDIWQSASDANQILHTGWIARILEQVYPNYTDELPETPMALLQGTTNNLLLTGDQGITGIMVDDPSSFLDLVSSTYYDSADNIIPDTSGGEELQFIRSIDNAAFEYSQYIQNVADSGTNTMEYANNALSIQLSTTAKLISGGMYSPFYIVYQGGYDTHADQVNRHGELMSDLSFALHNFYNDLENQGLADKVIVMTTSEFGRRPYQNGGNGTDHGSAAPMFVLGNTVNAGIIGNVPNLSTFDNNDNLFHEFDFRQVYSSILNQHFGLESDIISNALFNSYDSLDIISSSNTNLGDVNFDNQINIIDIVIMVNFILGLTQPTDEEFIAADVNEDGQLNILDLTTNISNILNSSNNLSIPVIKKVGITQKNKVITINKDNLIGGIEINFDKNCKVSSSVIDKDWVIRYYKNKIILYNPHLKSMKQDFSITCDKFSKINKIIISDKNGFAMQSRIYK